MHRVFQSAGLPLPNMRFEAVMDPRPDSPLYDYVGDTISSILPKALEYGIPNAADLDPASIPAKIRAELNAVGYAMLVAPTVHAWCSTTA